MKLFDAHCHLQFPQYEKDLPEVLARMRELEMGAIVVGTDYETSKMGVELAEKHDFLWASIGLHPNDNKEEVFDAGEFEGLAKHPKVVAIGECGLDYFRSSGEGQMERFQAQIALAQKLNKALIIHCREAHDDCLSVLQKTAIGSQVPVVMHFFTGSGELAQKYLDLGCYLSFPGPITYTDMYDESINAVSMDKILIETDAPFAAPVPNRGKRNEPSYVAEVARKIASVKNISLDEVSAQVVINSKRVFGI
jgi:TatD DNase family protein